MLTRCSFLESSQNTELIRWNEAGDGFIVLDEEEFARTLIPELFKHKNYASFVRQLNMYGFHKRVGLSDNSMKASERKNKAPSEYYNPYFRRGHPNLLWLISKPKSGNKKKNKKEENEMGSDDDGAEEIFPSSTANVAQGVSEVGPLQKKDIIQVKAHLEKLQQQQNTISAMLGQMRKDQTQLFQQAIAFQDQHNRHENSINAILNFLANVFRKSLEEQGGAQSVQELLASIIPNAQAHGQTPMPHQRSVVDLSDFGDFVNQKASAATAMSPPKRHQRLLLPPAAQSGKANTISPSSTAPATPQAPYQSHSMGSVTELLDTSPSDTSSPAYIKSELQSNPHQGMMKIIQDTNAGSDSTAHIDLPNVAANTSATITNDQRNKMLNIMSGQTSASAPSIPATSSAPSTAPPGSGLGQNPGTSLSPVIPSIPPPNFQDLQARSEQLDALQRLTSGTADGIAELTSMLGPLSPSGRIPGVTELGNPNAGYFDNVEFDQFLDNNAFSDLNYDPNLAAPALDGTDGDDFNFNLDDTNEYTTSGGAGSGFQPGKVLDSDDTPSPTGTEETAELQQSDLQSPERDAKRRRRA